MGVNLRDIVPKRAIALDDLAGKAIATDAYNALYQFLSIIRGADGQPLKDRYGRITSHLSGLFYRTVNLLEKRIRPVYVFDGTPPSLKEAEIKRRKKVKEEALVKYEEALRRGDLEGARKHAQATAELKDEMVDSAKKLLDAMGVPWIQAPSEGEAQAAYMAARGDVWAVASQDYDALLFGAARLVRNVAITGRRKLPGKPVYMKIQPELISLSELLEELGITREQLVDIGILVGTDFNPDGVRGVGPKTALKLVKEHGSLERALLHLGGADFPVEPSVIKAIFLNPNIANNYKLEWRSPDVESVIRFLCDEHDFSEGRVRKALDRVLKARPSETGGLEAFFPCR